MTALDSGRETTSRAGARTTAPLTPPGTGPGQPPVRRRYRRRLAGLVITLVVLAAGALVARHILDPAGRHQGTIAASAVPVPGPAPSVPSAVERPDAGSAPWPFPAPPGLRRPRPGELPTTLYADGRQCSVGCRPIGAVDAWPLQPFDRQHPLRAGLNELRGSGFHVGIDIQAPDGSEVYALQPGYVRILAASGPDARVQVGNYIYWHIRPTLPPGSYVTPLSQSLGTVMAGFGHLHLSEVNAAGVYLNPLRPGGRVLAPYVDTAPPVLAHPRVDATGGLEVAAFDPQSFTALTTYVTPVLAPAGLAYRLYDSQGVAVTPLQWALRGTWHLPATEVPLVYASDSAAPGYDCYTARTVCVPRWDYRLAGGLAPKLPLGLAAGTYRLTAYAFDWSGNVSAIDERVYRTAVGWEPVGRLQGPMAPIVGAVRVGGEAAGSGSGAGYGSRLDSPGRGAYRGSFHQSPGTLGPRGNRAGGRSPGRRSYAPRTGSLTAPASAGAGHGRGTPPGLLRGSGASGRPAHAYR